MIRAYKFLMRPTVGQQAALVEMLRDHCSLYNGALQEHRDAWRHASKTTVRYGQQSAQLKDIRAADPERQGRWSFSSQQATLRRLDRAFAAFFRRVRAARRRAIRVSGRPSGSTRWTSPRTATAAAGTPPRTTPSPASASKASGTSGCTGTGPWSARSRPCPSNAKRWYVILTAEQPQPEPLPATGSVAGIDLGIAHFLADSHGAFVPNPRHGAKAAKRLEAAQQALSRCKRGSKRRRKAVETVARLHRKIGRQRLDHAHKTALHLVGEYDFIAHEDLKIRNMSKAPAPRPDPGQPGSFLPNGAAAKAGLNRSISDAGWGVFLAILASKAEGAGRQVMAVDARNTSRRCPACGHTAKANRPTQEKFHCQACGHTAHADTVGAINVLRAGLARRETEPA